MLLMKLYLLGIIPVIAFEIIMFSIYIFLLFEYCYLMNFFVVTVVIIDFCELFLLFILCVMIILFEINISRWAAMLVI